MPVIGWDGTETHLHLVDVFAAVQILSPTAAITTVWHCASGEAPFKTIQVPVLAQSFRAWIDAIQVWYSASIITLSVSHTILVLLVIAWLCEQGCCVCSEILACRRR